MFEITVRNMSFRESEERVTRNVINKMNRRFLSCASFEMTSRGDMAYFIEISHLPDLGSGFCRNDKRFLTAFEMTNAVKF